MTAWRTRAKGGQRFSRYGTTSTKRFSLHSLQPLPAWQAERHLHGVQWV